MGHTGVVRNIKGDGKRDAALIALGVDTRLRVGVGSRWCVVMLIWSRVGCTAIKGGKESERIFSDETRDGVGVALGARCVPTDGCLSASERNLKGQGMTPDGLRGVPSNR